MNIDPTALFKLGYGLYVITSNDGTKDNGLIVNTVSQVTVNPDRISVAINKSNYSHDVILKSGIMNVNCLTIDTPFSVFERFGFQSGRDTDKFDGLAFSRSENGLAIPEISINSFISLKTDEYYDLGSHGMFICSITESKTLSDKESLTYAYYHSNIKPKPEQKKKKGFVCRICGYVYEGDELPDDFICPWCKHGASDFEPIE